MLQRERILASYSTEWPNALLPDKYTHNHSRSVSFELAISQTKNHNLFSYVFSFNVQSDVGHIGNFIDSYT